MKVTIDTTGFSYVLGVLSGYSKAATDKKFVESFLDYTHAELNDRFTTIVDAAALASPKTLHHVYEWGNVGQPGSRLWQVVLTGKGQTKTASVVWLPSNKPVPVDLRLTEGDGRTVQEGVHIFYWKAPLMESGFNVTIYPKHSEKKTLAYIGEDGEIHFSKRPVTLNPGGRQTTGSFTKLYYTFWNTTAEAIMDSEIKPRVQAQMNRAGTTAIDGRRRVFGIKADSYAFHAGENLGQKLLESLGIDFEAEARARRAVSYAS